MSGQLVIEHFNRVENSLGDTKKYTKWRDEKGDCPPNSSCMMAMYFLFGCIVSETPVGGVKNLLSLLLVIEHFLKKS
ncbi:MAG TPA: hypothetical protein VN227_02025 [Methanoregula sp.]|nr:hypothetical protein [Methanoregula sp.]